jgi:hypothetical protein
VCLLVRIEQLGSHWTLAKFDIWEFFSKSVDKIQVSLKSDNNNGTLHEDLCTFVIISRSILVRTINVSDKSCTENQNTHFMFNNFFRKSCHLWDNVEKYGRARQATEDNIIRRMRFACWITKATNTLRICNTDCFNTVTMVMRTRLNVTLYVHWLSRLILDLTEHKATNVFYSICTRSWLLQWFTRSNHVSLLAAGKGKSKFVPVHAMKAYRRNRGIAPLILKLDNRRSGVVDFKPRGLTWQKEHSYGPEGQCARLWEERNLLLLANIEPRIVQFIA